MKLHLIHDWGEWKDIKRDYLVSDKRRIGFGVIQERKCKVCNKKGLNLVTRAL